MSVNFYNENALNFFEGTVNSDMKDLYSLFLKELPKNASILDLGCGSGRDSKYFIDNGYKVIASDFSKELSILASQYIGQEVVVEDMRKITYENIFDGIWACASMLHLTENEIIDTLNRCYKALKEQGIIYLSFKYGNENYKKDGRSFTCFTEEKFLNLLSNTRLKCKSILQTNDVRKGRENEKWLNIILYR
ncbi:MAG: class I SAM-dependent methyltransferase [Fusobacterium perfoetens]|uniref:class I SAM-dependent methyltransferase n=1 Tax=Fusobacterium perfoetens TaxID=852 RepID=UPI0023F27CFD|nr:class I SAM-dependent methyltransferase [Fusobacterium perfoetens]MCI6152377.1 class I SAM-dependent methyltransferase [Fusobacterium perfoetens]MDY3236976.1 class I SAM-dependent methyltransferase [Fusobacterium perfoetens]